MNPRPRDLRAELAEYIRREELQGYSPERLHEYLVGLGYADALVEEALRAANSQRVYTPAAAEWQSYLAARVRAAPERTEGGRASDAASSAAKDGVRDGVATGEEKVETVRVPAQRGLVAVFVLAGVVLSLFGAGVRSSVFPLPSFLAVFRFVAAGFASFVLVVGLASLACAVGLWFAQRWARWAAVVLAVLWAFSVVGAPLSLVAALLWLGRSRR